MSLTEKITNAIDTLEAQIAADIFDAQRGRQDGDPEKIAIHANDLAANAIRLEVFNQVATWLVEAEPAPMTARNSGPLAMAAAMTTMM